MQRITKRSSLVLVALLGVSVAAAPQKPAAEPASPPPIRLPMARLVPDATIDMAGEREIAVTPDAVWISSRQAGTLTRIDAKTNAVTASIPVGGQPCRNVASGLGGVWVPLCDPPGIARVDPAAGKMAATLTTDILAVAGPAAIGVGSVWILTDAKGTLVRIDPDTNKPVAETYVPAGSSALAFGDDALWVATSRDGTLTRINPYTNVVAETIKVGGGPVAVATGMGSVWTLNGGDGTVSRVDAATNKVTATIKTGVMATSGALAAGEGSVWISAPGTPLTRIDPAANRMVQQFSGEGGGTVVIGFKSLWITATPTTVWRVDPQRVAATR